MSKLLDHALQLAADGFRVFPLVANGKTPAVDGWQTWSDDIAAHWARHPDHNIGIATAGLLVVDVDMKKGKDGNAELLRLELEGYDLPDTREHETPTGGRHIIMASPPVANSAGKLGQGLDIRGTGGYIVGPGSTIDGVPYVIRRDGPIAQAPTWLITRCGAPRERSADVIQPVVALDDPADIARAIRYLQHDAPHGAPGTLSDTSYRVAARVKDYGISRELNVRLMLEHWPHEPAMDVDDMALRVGNAYAFGLEPPGVASPRADFEPVPPPVVAPVAPPLRRLNRDHAFILVGGRRSILWETADAQDGACIITMDVPTFHDKLRPETIDITGKAERPITEEWMAWTGRRSYDGYVFLPCRPCSPRYYNLWRGFAVEPAVVYEPGPAMRAFLEHARENVCRGDAAAFHYLISFFAHLVQRPWEKPLVAPVFKGLKGVGKNALIERICALFGDHAMVAADDRYLTGNFNAHFENKLILVLDEAAWAGDKRSEGKLKGLITGSHHNIEHKGKEAYQAVNLVRVFILGNDNWVVPASEDERRFAVFDVGPGRRLDTQFFEDMRLGMERGEYAQLLRFLLDWDLTGFNINIAPSTPALLEQKVASLEPLGEWWLEGLAEGRIAGADFPGWPAEPVEKERLRQAFSRYARDRGIRARLPPGKVLTASLKGWGVTVGEAPGMCRLPALAEARSCWDRFIGHSGEWGG